MITTVCPTEQIEASHAGQTRTQKIQMIDTLNGLWMSLKLFVGTKH